MTTDNKLLHFDIFAALLQLQFVDGMLYIFVSAMADEHQNKGGNIV
jgi:hypothetical protein